MRSNHYRASPASIYIYGWVDRSTCLASRISTEKESFPGSEFKPASIWTCWMLIDRQMQSASLRRPLVNQNILLQASDLDFRFDLGSDSLQFPTEVAATTLRPDVVIYSRTKKIVIMLELTHSPARRPLASRAWPKDVEVRPPPPCPHMWGAWLHNSCLCFGSRLSRFLPTHVPHLLWGAWSTRIVTTPDKNRVCACGTALLLPPVPSDSHRTLEWPWVSFGMNPGFTCKLHLTLSSSFITNSQAWFFPIFTWRRFQRLQRYVFAEFWGI